MTAAATAASGSRKTSQSPARDRRRGSIFVTYNGLLDPLGPSQILPYLERLNADWPVHILSFERPDKLANRNALAAMRERVDSQGIQWTWLRYHKWPSLPATTFDLLNGAWTLRRILARENIGLVHARGYLPTSIALRASRRHPVLFDIRGLQPEEYVDGGVWKEGELKWRLAKRSERTFFRRAAGAVVLTENIRPYVEGRVSAVGRSVPIEVVPCCVQLDRFRFDEQARVARRRELGVADDAVLFVYSGSVGTWYLVDEMARFVRLFGERTGRKVVLLWLANNDREAALAAGKKAGLADSQQRAANAAASEVASWLSAADAALALIRPCFSKRSSSPTKYAECLAVGLPLVISRDVGDGARVADREGAVALEHFDDDALATAALRLAPMIGRSREKLRSIAVDLFDIDTVAMPSYRRLYERLVLP